jgi:hypothetical protein
MFNFIGISRLLDADEELWLDPLCIIVLIVERNANTITMQL